MRFRGGFLGASLAPLFAPSGDDGVGMRAVPPLGARRRLTLALATLALPLGVLASALASQTGANVYVTNIAWIEVTSWHAWPVIEPWTGGR